MTDPDVLLAAVLRLRAEGDDEAADTLVNSVQQKAMSAYSMASGGALVPAVADQRKKQLKLLLTKLVRNKKRSI